MCLLCKPLKKSDFEGVKSDIKKGERYVWFQRSEKFKTKENGHGKQI